MKAGASPQGAGGEERSRSGVPASAPASGKGAPRLEIGAEDTWTVMGQRGTGKTTLCQALARLAAPRVCVVDPLGQYPAEYAYRPARFARKEMDKVGALAWSMSPVRVIVEEAEQVFPQGPDLPPKFKQFALMGRNLGSSWGMNTRRPQDLSKILLDNSDHIFMFKLGGRALRYMAEYIADEADDEEEAKRVLGMRSWVKDPRQGGGRFLWYHDGELREMAPLKVASRSPAPGPTRAPREAR